MVVLVPQAATTKDRAIKPHTADQRIFLCICLPPLFDNPECSGIPKSMVLISELALPLSPFFPRAPVREKPRRLFKLPGEKERPAAPWISLAGPALIASDRLAVCFKMQVIKA